MNHSLIPNSLYWMIPVVDDLSRQRARNTNRFTLNEKNRELISRHLTVSLRKDIELWIGSTNSEEASSFLMAMTALDELGLLQKSEPILSYEHWRSELMSPLWGHVRGAAQIISSDFLIDLSEEKRLKLDAYIEKILKSVTNMNSRIWLTWLRCRIDAKLDIGREFLRKIIDEYPVHHDEELDLSEDSCCALISLPNTSGQDIQTVTRFVLREDVDEFKAAAALEALLISSYVTLEDKLGVIALVDKTDRREIRNVVKSYDLRDK